MLFTLTGFRRMSVPPSLSQNKAATPLENKWGHLSVSGYGVWAPDKKKIQKYIHENIDKIGFEGSC